MVSFESAWATVAPYLERFAIWRGYELELQTLAIYGIGIAIYTALVFTFYQALSRRRPVHFKVADKPGWGGRFARLVEKGLVFPVMSFAYFAVLAAALFVLVKGQSTQGILLIAMAVVVGVRVTVYLSEAMSNDLAKLVPLSLLGVTLVDPGYLTLATAWTRLGEAIQLAPLLGRYFLLFIALEAVFGMVRGSLQKAGRKYDDVRTRKLTKPRAEEPTFSVVVKDAEAPKKKAP